jgi:hypothetical protein
MAVLEPDGQVRTRHGLRFLQVLREHPVALPLRYDLVQLDMLRAKDVEKIAHRQTALSVTPPDLRASALSTDICKVPTHEQSCIFHRR